MAFDMFIYLEKYIITYLFVSKLLGVCIARYNFKIK